MDRTTIIPHSQQILKNVNKRAFLDIRYKDEVGTGLGPTLEFFYLVSHDLKNVEGLWRKMDDLSYFPSPLDISKTSNEEISRIYELFRVAGGMMAKAITDDRLFDLPLS